MTVAARDGYYHMRRDDVALEAKCASGLVNTYFGTMKQLRRAVMRQAIKEANVTILSTGLAMRDSIALRAPDDLKAQAASTLTG